MYWFSWSIREPTVRQTNVLGRTGIRFFEQSQVCPSGRRPRIILPQFNLYDKILGFYLTNEASPYLVEHHAV